MVLLNYIVCCKINWYRDTHRWCTDRFTTEPLKLFLQYLQWAITISRPPAEHDNQQRHCLYYKPWPRSHTFTLHLLPTPVGLLVLPCTCHCRQSATHPLIPSPSVFLLSLTEEPAKADTCACDRRALQQLALNVHNQRHPENVHRVLM